jgi:GNAT superfamily N-acetyltransferase
LTIEFLRFASGERLSDQRELFDDAFPEHRGLSSASSEHYRWKFHGSPFVPQSYEYAADEDGKMLGYYGAIPYPYEIGGRTVLAGMVCDVMTHSQARGRGVFTQLGRYALKELEMTELAFVTGYPVRPEVMGGHLRVGWKVAFKLPMYLRPLGAEAVLASRGLGWLAMAVKPLVIAYQWLLRPRTGKVYTSTTESPRDVVHSREFQLFLDEWHARVPNHLVKSPAFYEWRLGAPGTDYVFFLVRRGDEVVAAAVGREVVLHQVPSFALLDVMALPDRRGALGSLHGAIDREARERGVEAVVTMMSRRRAREYRLIRHGFVRSPFTFKLILRSVDDSLPVDQIANERDWHLMWIDSDDL